MKTVEKARKKTKAFSRAIGKISDSPPVIDFDSELFTTIFVLMGDSFEARYKRPETASEVAGWLDWWTWDVGFKTGKVWINNEPTVLNSHGELWDWFEHIFGGEK